MGSEATLLALAKVIEAALPLNRHAGVWAG
jgi:hypothetical protein